MSSVWSRPGTCGSWSPHGSGRVVPASSWCPPHSRLICVPTSPSHQERPARLGDPGPAAAADPEGLREYASGGPGDPLRRIVKQRSSIVKRRATGVPAEQVEDLVAAKASRRESVSMLVLQSEAQPNAAPPASQGDVTLRRTAGLPGRALGSRTGALNRDDAGRSHCRASRTVRTGRPLLPGPRVLPWHHLTAGASPGRRCRF
jgi:hypothetical protein